MTDQLRPARLPRTLTRPRTRTPNLNLNLNRLVLALFGKRAFRSLVVEYEYDFEFEFEDRGTNRMTTPDPFPASSVIGQLLSEGYRFNFFQAVRLLELWEADRAPVGHDAAPQREAVRFGTHASVEFPASQIDDILPASDETHPARMTVNFFGLAGPMGALPLHYTEIVLERLARKDRVLLEFLDLFNHRLLSLFYRAWEKYQFWIVGERALYQDRRVAQAGPEALRAFVLDQRPHLDPIGQILLSLSGLGSPATRYVLPHRDKLEPRTEIADQTWRFYAGLLSHRHRPANKQSSRDKRRCRRTCRSPDRLGRRLRRRVPRSTVPNDLDRAAD